MGVGGCGVYGMGVGKWSPCVGVWCQGHGKSAFIMLPTRRSPRRSPQCGAPTSEHLQPPTPTSLPVQLPNTVWVELADDSYGARGARPADYASLAREFEARKARAFEVKWVVGFSGLATWCTMRTAVWLEDGDGRPARQVETLTVTHAPYTRHGRSRRLKSRPPRCSCRCSAPTRAASCWQSSAGGQRMRWPPCWRCQGCPPAATAGG